jgi:hypothetical protein
LEDTDEDPKRCFLAPLVVLAAVSFPPPRSAFANNNIAQLLLPFFVVQEDVVTIIEKRNTKTKKLLLLFVVKLNIVALVIIVSSTPRRRRRESVVFSPETLSLSLSLSPRGRRLFFSDRGIKGNGAETKVVFKVFVHSSSFLCVRFGCLCSAAFSP